MRHPVLRTLLFFVLATTLTAPLHAAETYKEITWETLVPKGWDPTSDMKKLDLGKLQDSDPKATEALQKIKEMWDNAPTEPSLQGTRVRLPGFVVPLDRKGDKVTEFLLVPYFGACIHTPPPPANQIIHVISKTPQAKLNTMDSVWVSGVITLQHSDTPWGGAGYRLTVEKISPYKTPYKGSRLDLF